MSKINDYYADVAANPLEKTELYYNNLIKLSIVRQPDSYYSCYITFSNTEYLFITQFSNIGELNNSFNLPIIITYIATDNVDGENYTTIGFSFNAPIDYSPQNPQGVIVWTFKNVLKTTEIVTDILINPYNEYSVRFNTFVKCIIRRDSLTRYSSIFKIDCSEYINVTKYHHLLANNSDQSIQVIYTYIYSMKGKLFLVIKYNFTPLNILEQKVWTCDRVHNVSKKIFRHLLKQLNLIQNV